MSASSADGASSAERSEAVNNFREYLRIPSVQPNVNYDECVKFLQKQAKSLDLPIKIINITPKHPIVIITWVGKNPQLPSILLNGHMDVVPVFENEWKHSPFGAEIVNGNIYARGAQDMKCVSIQYLEAIRKLKQAGQTFLRTIHISFVPDEEIGADEGMRKFVHMEEFKSLNIGFALDEGIASPTEDFIVFYGERTIWHFDIYCPGNGGHGSLLLDNTAGEKVTYLLNKFYTFREGEKKKLRDNPTWTIGDVTTVNLTMLGGGVQYNVVPVEFKITLDCRIANSVDLVEWENTIRKWCKEAGSDIRIDFAKKDARVPLTKIDKSNPYWISFKSAVDEIGLKVKPQIFTGGTDSRFLRGIGLPAIGFSPINNTPVLLHDNDEFLGVETFLKGIDIYCDIIKKVANVEDRTG